MPELLDASVLPFEAAFEGFGGSWGCGERVAWGALGGGVRLFLVEPSVTELLFRRSPLLFRFDAFFEAVEALLFHADAAATVTVCGVWLGGVGHLAGQKGRCGEGVWACESVEASLFFGVTELNWRVSANCLAMACFQVPT